MTQHERVTFTQGRDVIEHAISYLTTVGELLDTLRERQHDERVNMLLASVSVEQRNLLGALERLLEDTSGKVLDTYTQYTVELPRPQAPSGELTTLTLIQWLEGHNGSLQAVFAELAEKRDSEEVADVFAGIAGQLEAHDRRLSKEYQRMQDL